MVLIQIEYGKSEIIIITYDNDAAGDGSCCCRFFMSERSIMNTTKVKNVNGEVGKGVKFERIRRITGYLVGTIDRFNDAKAKEVKERVKHGLG